MLGGLDRDIMYGQGGNDELRGGVGHDYMEGNGGDDEMFGDAGQDDMLGGTGRTESSDPLTAVDGRFDANGPDVRRERWVLKAAQTAPART